MTEYCFSILDYKKINGNTFQCVSVSGGVNVKHSKNVLSFLRRHFQKLGSYYTEITF